MLGSRGKGYGARQPCGDPASFAFLCALVCPNLPPHFLISKFQLPPQNSTIRRALQRIAILNAVLTSILPGLALKIFIALVPAIIMAMNRFAGMVSLSQMDLALTSRFFVFQVGVWWWVLGGVTPLVWCVSVRGRGVGQVPRRLPQRFPQCIWRDP